MIIGASVFPILVALATTLLGHFSLALTQDGLALLEVKTSLNDTKDSLSNWNYSDDTPCKWVGITCSPQDQRVISINLPYMQLGGFISPNISKLSRLQRLALHQNSLHGIIPGEIGQCSDLRAVYLRGNYLHGDIPSTIGNLSKLTILDLSSNSLQGDIPPTLEGLVHLKYLNLSVNMLSGEIPHVGAISNFGYMAFIGNSKLCGLQVNRPCKENSLGFPAVLPHPESDKATSSSGHKRSSHYIKGLVIGGMSMIGFVVLLLVGLLLIWFLTKKERAVKSYTEVKKQVYQEPRAKLITFHGDLPYTSCELVEKIESLDEEDIVGAGGYGTVYRMVMNDCATFAVKKIDRSREGSDQVFEMELEILGSVKHINLVNLRGYCRLPTAKLLIYDFLPKGSLDHFLHDSLSEDHLLNWNDRLRVAIGSARGLAYLHHDCSPKIVHGDIKSSNILLDENLTPRVSDFGLSKLLVDGDAHVTTVVAGTFGYLAPEYLQSGVATEKSDVYSYGVVLLELVTGKRPTDSAFVKRGLNVVGWMNTVLRDNRLEDVVDRRCGDAEAETVEAVVEIATRCTDANPEERPSMQEVVEFLEQEAMMSPYASEFYESQSDR